ncbi:hypothetical protein E2C01_088769 [Portunus trituberculatus]|uniref:Uncharacterized protein n=1 Tax=Portunus trituberculatus TaxID=210409 RepID=A0A5B7JMT3_PORTR|nr:hypothetical protein [Portunus trituberculatus]
MYRPHPVDLALPYPGLPTCPTSHSPITERRNGSAPDKSKEGGAVRGGLVAAAHPRAPQQASSGDA